MNVQYQKKMSSHSGALDFIRYAGALDLIGYARIMSIHSKMASMGASPCALGRVVMHGFDAYPCLVHLLPRLIPFIVIQATNLC